MWPGSSESRRRRLPLLGSLSKGGDPASVASATAILQLEADFVADRGWAAESESSQRGYVDNLRFKYTNLSITTLTALP